MGKLPFAASRWKTTVASSGASVFPGDRTPPSAESALDAFFGSTSDSNVVLTSFAVKVAPLWKVTPWRILNVHSVPSALGDQLSASRGSSSSFALENERNSPVEPSSPAPPSSLTMRGLGSFDVWMSATLMLPRDCTALVAVGLVLVPPPVVSPLPPPPQAAARN